MVCQTTKTMRTVERKRRPLSLPLPHWPHPPKGERVRRYLTFPFFIILPLPVFFLPSISPFPISLLITVTM